MLCKAQCFHYLHQRKATAKTQHYRATVQRQIDATDNQIDAPVDGAPSTDLVYDLYELTDQEIKIVEQATN